MSADNLAGEEHETSTHTRGGDGQDQGDWTFGFSGTVR